MMRLSPGFSLETKDSGVNSTVRLLKARGLPPTMNNIKEHLEEGDRLARGEPLRSRAYHPSLEDEADHAIALMDRFCDGSERANRQPGGDAGGQRLRLRALGVDV
jgi:hypothetical protein